MPRSICLKCQHNRGVKKTFIKEHVGGYWECRRECHMIGYVELNGLPVGKCNAFKVKEIQG